jgi:hypothetical protein
MEQRDENGITMATMNEEKRQTKKRKIKLRGERPPGVIGEMKPEKLIEMLDRWQREGSLEEEERIWKELDRILSEEPIRI